MNSPQIFAIKWLPVKGYEGIYEVSELGEIRKTSGVLLKQWLSDQGYAMVRVSGPRAVLRVHRVVAESFVKNPLSLPFVNHLDCERSHNAATNLEWCTQKENLAHSQKLGRMQRSYWTGRRSPNSKLSYESAENIRTEYATGNFSMSDLATLYETNKRTIGRIISGEYYAQPTMA